MSIIDVYFWWVPMLAMAVSNSGISPEAVGVIVGSVVTALLGGGLIGKKVADARKVTVENNPLEVSLKEQFVTRREFERLESTVALSATRMEGLFEKTMQAVAIQNTTLSQSIENNHLRLARKIEDASTGAYKGRQKLWDQVNEQREDLAALKATSDVSAQLGKLATVIEAVVKPQAAQGAPKRTGN